MSSLDENEVLAWAAAVESQSQHPIARGVVESAETREVALKPVEDFRINAILLERAGRLVHEPDADGRPSSAESEQSPAAA